MISDKRKEYLLGLIKNDEAKKKVKQLNAAGEAVINIDNPADKTLAAYKEYRRLFAELKEKYPDWDSKLNKPIEYSSFILDYNEKLFETLSKSSQHLYGKSPVEVFTLNMHGINLRSIEILQQKLIELEPGSLWADPHYFNTHIKEAFAVLRAFYPDDNQYDEIFSPKETTVSLF